MKTLHWRAIAILVTLGLLLLACTQTEPHVTADSYVSLLIESSQALAAADATIHYDPATLEFVGLETHHDSILAVAHDTGQTVKLGIITLEAVQDSLLEVVFKVKAGNPQATLVAFQAYDLNGIDLDTAGESTSLNGKLLSDLALYDVAVHVAALDEQIYKARGAEAQ